MKIIYQGEKAKNVKHFTRYASVTTVSFMVFNIFVLPIPPKRMELGSKYDLLDTPATEIQTDLLK